VLARSARTTSRLRLSERRVTRRLACDMSRLPSTSPTFYCAGVLQAACTRAPKRVAETPARRFGASSAGLVEGRGEAPPSE
jgi:hypothetical protein